LISKLPRQSKLIISTTVHAHFMYVTVQLTGHTSRETEIKLWTIANRGFSRGRPAPTIDRVEPLILAGLAAYRSEKQTACPIVRWYQRQSAKNGRTNKSRVEPHGPSRTAPRFSRLFSIDNQSFPTPRDATIL